MHARDVAAALTALLDGSVWQWPHRFAVGVSGGADSLALLHALAADPRLASRLVAWHVHHGLQRAADEFEAVSRRQAQAAGVPCDVFRVSVCGGEGGSEAAARTARYRAFASALQPGDALVLAHHADDQAETLLLNALRGAGGRGLAGMPAARRLGFGVLLRPLLGMPRDALDAYAARLDVPRVSDPHNRDLAYDRVFLRREVIPQLRRRWPDAGMRLATSAGHGRAHWHVAERGARVEMARRAGVDATLAWRALGHRTRDAQLELLSAWLRTLHIRPPGQRRLVAFLDALGSTRADHAAELAWDGHWLRHYAGRLYAGVERPPPGGGTLSPDRSLSLGPGNGRLTLVATDGPGFTIPPAGLVVRCRGGGERIDLGRGRPRQTLKELLRAARILPWWREALPLAFADGELVAIADLWQRDAREEGRRYRVRWHDAPRVAAR